MKNELALAVRCCRNEDCEHCPLQPQICDELTVEMESVPAELLDLIEEALGSEGMKDYEKCKVFRIKGETGDCVGNDDFGEIDQRCAECPCYRRYVGMKMTKPKLANHR